jgi:pimeloyl-ACP methyl ester carboxylesterase
MATIEHTIQLTDGRNLSVLEQGQRRGKPVIYLHGMPGSNRDHSNYEELHQQLGIRLISVNRPGIGTSSTSDNHDALSFANDLLKVMKQLEIEKASIIGFSSGGQYGCAFAHSYPERVERLALLSSGGPFDLYIIGDKRTEAIRAFHDAARDNPSALLEQFSKITSPETLLALMYSMISPEDQQIVAQPKNLSQFLLVCEDVIAQGLDKLIKEITIFNSPWGFSPSEITVETLIWHGTADINIPVECSEYLAREIPSSIATYIEGAGHYFSFAQWPDLLKKITTH